MCSAEYGEDDFLQLSGIQHFAFCRRQWALIHVEGAWAENERTLSGEYMHERAHDTRQDGISGDRYVARGMPVHSRRLGISGACDVVEFLPDANGVPIQGREGRFRPYPVEYKHGAPKEDDCDRLQLCAQAICLEEMLATPVPEGALFYGETRRRERVAFDDALRRAVEAAFSEMHDLMRRGHTPGARRTRACNACSLRDACLPAIAKTPSVREYIARRLGESDA